MAYEYRIEIEPTNHYTDLLQEKGWTEMWKIFVFYHPDGKKWDRDIAMAPQDYPEPRHEFYLAPSKEEARDKAEQIARDHAAKLKAAEQAPLKYKFMVP